MEAIVQVMIVPPATADQLPIWSASPIGALNIPGTRPAASALLLINLEEMPMLSTTTPAEVPTTSVYGRSTM